jgi:histidine triad (HIT) family protein
MGDCIFCKIVKKEAPATVEFENDNLIAFRNINPIAPVHVLIVPKKHIAKLSEISEEDQSLMGEVLLIAKNIAKKLGISEAFRVALANGENAGQSVFHLHFHLTGGWKEKYTREEDRG